MRPAELKHTPQIVRAVKEDKRRAAGAENRINGSCVRYFHRPNPLFRKDIAGIAAEIPVVIGNQDKGFISLPCYFGYDQGNEFGEIMERLSDQVVDAEFADFLFMLGSRAAAHADAGGCGAVLAGPSHEFDAIDIRHLDIGKEQVDPAIILQDLKGSLAADCRNDSEIEEFKIAFEKLDDFNIVIRDKYLCLPHNIPPVQAMKSLCESFRCRIQDDLMYWRKPVQEEMRPLRDYLPR